MKTPDGNSFRMCHSSYKVMTSSPNFFPSSHSSSKQYFCMVSENPLFYLLPTPLVYPLLLLPITLSLLLDVSFHHQCTTRSPTCIISAVSFNPQTLWVSTMWIALMKTLYCQETLLKLTTWIMPFELDQRSLFFQRSQQRYRKGLLWRQSRMLILAHLIFLIAITWNRKCAAKHLWKSWKKRQTL